MAIAATDLDRQVAGIGDLVQLPASDPYTSEDMLLDLSKINMLEQIRKTYDGIDELATDFTRKGMMHRVQVALLSPARARKHIEMVNLVWGTTYTLGDLKPYSSTPRRYAILVTGHRRMHAHLQLWFQGCKKCNERYGTEIPGACYRRHKRLPFGHVKATVYRYITPEEAMATQCTENIHKTVPADQQADAYERLFVVRSQQNPSLSVAEFARDMGCDPDTVRQARRYCRLSRVIRDDVEAGRLAYGAALELGRYQERMGLSDNVICDERENLIVNPRPVAKIRASFDRRIAAYEAGQGGLFGEDALVDSNRRERRRVYDSERVRALHGFGVYLRRAKRMTDEGRMGPNAEFLDTSLRRLLLRELDLFESFLPDARLAKSELERASRVSTELRELIAQINAAEAAELLPLN